MEKTGNWTIDIKRAGFEISINGTVLFSHAFDKNPKNAADCEEAWKDIGYIDFCVEGRTDFYKTGENCIKTKNFVNYLTTFALVRTRSAKFSHAITVIL